MWFFSSLVGDVVSWFVLRWWTGTIAIYTWERTAMCCPQLGEHQQRSMCNILRWWLKLKSTKTTGICWTLVPYCETALVDVLYGLVFDTHFINVYYRRCHEESYIGGEQRRYRLSTCLSCSEECFSSWTCDFTKLISLRRGNDQGWQLNTLGKLQKI